MADSLTSLLTHRELIESENRYRRITETLTDYQFSVRIENNRAVQTIQSPACKAVTGYTPEEFESDPFLWFKMVAPEDRELVQKRVNQIMAGEEIPPIEHRIIRKDGEIRWICDTTILFKDESGKLLSYDGVIKDITDRKKAEIEIARANRALRMLSDSNQALIHINDESELLNEVCRIVVEVGGYSLAWIGFLEYNDAKTLRPVAHAGNNSGYIEMANVSWGDNAQGQGPGGVSVRTGKPCVIRNISSDKSFSPWHEAAIQRGFKAIIALPLVYEGETFGTIGIYSQEQDEFDENEIEILKELSDDLSFGIASLRIRVQKSLAESALQVSEERFSAAFRYSPLAIAIFREADGYIVDVNEVFIKTSGYSRDEIIGHTTDELGLYANPADREKVMQLLKERGVVESFEFEGSNKSGERRNMLSAITYIIFNGEKHYLALILDITERKKSEEQLRILNTALEAAANAILVTDKNGIIIWTNKAFLKLTGYLLEEAIGHNPGELVNSGIHSNEFFENMWSTILSGNIWNGEIVNRRKDESLYNEYMTITPVLDKEKKITQFIAVKQDITEKKLAEIALLDSEKKYRIVADNTYNWEFWSDPEGKYIYCSPSCLRVTGYSEQEFFADPELSFKIVHTDYRSLFNEHILNSTKENNAINIQYKIIRKDGSERWIEHVCQPVFDDNGNYLGRRGSNSDITEKKEADRLILNAIISTEESERNRFSQELHDGLGPMLSTVKLYFQWLAETTNAKKQKNIAQTGLQNIDDAIQAVREISNNLSPRILVNFGLVPALKNLIHRINETKILNIDFKYDGEQRYISQIEATLYRIISELLNNTMKYAKAHNIFINLSHNLSKNRLEIVYTDDGKGFDFNKVLEKKSGMGIQNIIQRVATLDGIVNFNTKEGKTLFVNIELPIINKEQA